MRSFRSPSEQLAWRLLLFTVTIPPSGRLLKVPLMGLSEVLLITVSTRACFKAPLVWPLRKSPAALLLHSAWTCFRSSSSCEMATLMSDS